MATKTHLLLEDIIQEITINKKVPKLLLHSCCAPCSSYVLLYLSQYFKITVFFYNPNIMPILEYQRRLEEQKKLLTFISSKYPINFIEGDYDNDSFLEQIKGLEMEPEGHKRCLKCYLLRLTKTAQQASNNYDYFATTLTISPYKNAKIINEIGTSLEKEFKVKYLPSDFKKKDGYKKSIDLAKKYNLYRQQYCGCQFSIK